MQSDSALSGYAYFCSNDLFDPMPALVDVQRHFFVAHSVEVLGRNDDGIDVVDRLYESSVEVLTGGDGDAEAVGGRPLSTKKCFILYCRSWILVGIGVM